MKSVHTVRLATRRRSSMPPGRRTELMGAPRPQTPRRSPWQAFGGTARRSEHKPTHQHVGRTIVLNCPPAGSGQDASEFGLLSGLWNARAEAFGFVSVAQKDSNMAWS